MKKVERVNRVEDVNFEALIKEGYEYFLFDFDNTLAPWREENVDESKRKILENLSKKAHVVIVSNGTPRRVELPATFIWRAGKPFSFKLWKFLRRKKVNPKRCVMIGDQIFTDVLMGKLFGFRVIKVKPLSSKEFFGTKILRFFERIVEGQKDENG
ncbi:YqeG family HAD IIIA-type phosphatase [Thermotoga sp. KOL6]|uniref:YqeG family HAD IIIA-type phosphatase n=1 Tax=Thermotoga sp. KOL6 TaxID=126741 RepID=UPI000C769C57|nr:HAD-IIIA family hydrolase [Thermotoga sp. KOL6]PLV58760.1 HAD family hydrolase [Thermotoga sp. KOL6]